MTASSGTGRIAKNTLFLYIRMLILMSVTLYTSRVVLQTLGVTDYGVYAIVGGIVAMFGFFNSAMSSATQRFLSYDIGKGDKSQLEKTFNTTLNIHILISIFSLVLAETLGLWYVNTQLNIPDGRIYAVNWVYQFSVLTFVMGILQVPYNALIVARERMGVFAYISILDATLKLAIVYLLLVFDIDKLILYSFLIFLVSFIIRLIYQIYCRRNFEESKYKFYFDKTYYKTVLAYSGWNLFGNFAAVARGQGNNIILNFFFGPIINAAYSISLQVQSAVYLFVQNFQIAVNPQIVKSYAAEDVGKSLKLIGFSSRIAYYLTFLLVFPILINTDYLLSLWLKEVPAHTTTFVQLAIISTLIDSISLSLMTGAQATGRIKAYQAVVGLLIFLNLPISYIFLRSGANAEVVFIVGIFISLVALLFRLFFLKKIMNLDVVLFIKDVILRVLIITIVVVLIWCFMREIYQPALDEAIKVLLETFSYCSLIVLFTFLIGIKKSERKTLLSFFKLH